MNNFHFFVDKWEKNNNFAPSHFLNEQKYIYRIIFVILICKSGIYRSAHSVYEL